MNSLVARSLAPSLPVIAAPARAQTPPRRRYIKRDSSQRNAFSQAVITEGGKTVWLAGQTSALVEVQRASPS